MKSPFDEFRWSSTGSTDKFLVGHLGEKIERSFDVHAPQSLAGGPPAMDEEIFEWRALLDSVLHAKDRFVMIEVGAGFGRWLISAACALRQRRGGIPFSLIGVEAEPTHFEWMLRHFANNGIDSAQHRLIRGAIAERDGVAKLIVGMEGNAAEWYGQTLVNCTGYDANALPPAQLLDVPTLSIATLLADLDRVDFLDCDVQGAERDAIPAGLEVMTRKVKRVYVSTHYNGLERRTEIDSTVWHAFHDFGWVCEHHFEPACEGNTVYGHVQFQDGVQSWLNPKIP